MSNGIPVPSLDKAQESMSEEWDPGSEISDFSSNLFLFQENVTEMSLRKNKGVVPVRHVADQQHSSKNVPTGDSIPTKVYSKGFTI